MRLFWQKGRKLRSTERFKTSAILHARFRESYFKLKVNGRAVTSQTDQQPNYMEVGSAWQVSSWNLQGWNSFSVVGPLFISPLVKIEGDGRKFLDRLKKNFGSQISSQSLNEVHIYPDYSRNPQHRKCDFFPHIFVFDCFESPSVTDCRRNGERSWRSAATEVSGLVKQATSIKNRGKWTEKNCKLRTFTREYDYLSKIGTRKRSRCYWETRSNRASKGNTMMRRLELTIKDKNIWKTITKLTFCCGYWL